MYGFKLMRERKDGTVGPLFINRRAVLPFNVWLGAEDVPTPGYKHRPGWHILLAPYAPHLSEKGRVWVFVEFEDYETIKRPERQGGCWYLAKRMCLIHSLGGLRCVSIGSPETPSTGLRSCSWTSQRRQTS